MAVTVYVAQRYQLLVALDPRLCYAIRPGPVCMCIDACINMYVETCTNMFIGMRIDMFVDMSMDVGLDVCPSILRV